MNQPLAPPADAVPVSVETKGRRTTFQLGYLIGALSALFQAAQEIMPGLASSFPGARWVGLVGLGVTFGMLFIRRLVEESQAVNYSQPFGSGLAEPARERLAAAVQEAPKETE